MKEETVIEAHSSYVLGLLFTSDSRTLLSAGMDNLVKLWSVPDWKLVRSLDGHSKSVNTMSLSPDNKTLATGSTDATVKLWSFPDGRVLHTLQDRKKVVATVQFSPDGEWVAAGSYGGRVTVWTLSGDEVVSLQASKKNLSSITFSPDGTMLATAGLGDDILLWALPNGHQVSVLSGHKGAVMALTFIDNGRTLVSLGYEQSIKFWDTETWREVRSFHSNLPGVRGFAVSPNEETVALILESKVQLRSVLDGALGAELPVGTKSVSALAFSPDGRWLAVGAADRRIRLWEIQ